MRSSSLDVFNNKSPLLGAPNVHFGHGPSCLGVREYLSSAGRRYAAEPRVPLFQSSDPKLSLCQKSPARTICCRQSSPPRR